MTKIESNQFVDVILKGFWPRWDPSKIEVEAWLERLWPYDYQSAKTAVNNLVFGLQSRGVEPPCGRIMNALKAGRQQQTERNEPRLLYTIVAERVAKLYSEYPASKFGMKFSMPGNKPAPDKQLIEQDAERNRERANQLYGENHIICYA